MSNPILKSTLLSALGIICLLAGITLVLREWASLVIVFKGLIGFVLSVTGLFILFLVSGKSTKT